MYVFTSTIHDPENRLGYLIDEQCEELTGLFDSSHVAYTPTTHSKTVQALADRGFEVQEAEASVLDCYRTAFRMAIRPGVDNIFYCDLDRALHWVKSYPDELKALAKSQSDSDFTIVGRTKRAFGTHPETQTITEGLGNLLASRALGFSDTRDVLGVTYMITSRLAKQVLDMEARNRFGFYVEWPIFLWRSSRHPRYIEAEGLEWETPDRYRAEIKEMGLENWFRQYQTAEEWRKRTEMLRDFAESSI